MRSIYTATVSLGSALLWLAITLITSAHVTAEDRSLREAVPHDDFVIREEMRDGSENEDNDLIISRRHVADVRRRIKGR